MAIPIPQRTIINPSGDPALARTQIELAIANGGVYVFDTTKDIYVTAVEQTYTQQYVTSINNNPGSVANGVQFNSNGTFSADANFTYNAGTDTLNLENLLISGGIANLGPVANVRIGSGTNGQVLQTDGAGNLSWATVSGVGNSSSISNGNSNVNIGTANGNVTVGVSGNAAILTVTGTGANIAGTANVSGNLTVIGNANVGNIGVASGIFTANANLSGNLNVIGNANVGNVNAANGIFTANANVGGNLNVTGVASITANANVTGNLNVTANANITANVYAGNLVGLFANGNSNISITSNANIVFGVTGNANVFTVDANSVTVKSTNGNLVLGRATATGSPGLSSTSSITLTANRGNTEKSWTFGTNGNLNLPGTVGNSYILYGNGDNYTGNIGFTGDAIYDSNGVIVENANLTTAATAAVIIPSNGDANAIQINNYKGAVNVTSSANGVGNAQTWTLDTVGALNLAGNGVVRNQSGYKLINMVGNYGAQLQWTTDAGVASPDPNFTTEPINWLYVDSDGIHLETNINNGNSASHPWSFGNDGNAAFAGSINFPNSSINVATANFIGIYPVGNITDQTYLELLEGANGYAALTSNANIYLTTGKSASAGNSWIFDSAGVLSLPQNLGVGAAVIQPGATDYGLEIIVNGATWTYGTDASLTIPGNINLPAGSSYVGVNANSGLSVVTSSLTKLSGDTNVAIVANSSGGNSYSWTFDNTGNLTLPGVLWAQASDNGSIVFSNNGNDNNGSLKVDGGFNMVVSANSNFYVKRAGSDRLAITDTTTDLMASTNVVIHSNKAGTENQWIFSTTGNLIIPGAIKTPNNISIGNLAGNTSQGSNSVAIGTEAGFDTQGQNSVAIGPIAGRDTQGIYAVAVGQSAGSITQGQGSVAVGESAGYELQGTQSVAVGSSAGYNTQGNSAVAIGANAASYYGSDLSIAIGYQAGFSNLASSAIAIGANAGVANTTNNSIYIGAGAGANGGSFANVIVLSASTSNLTPAAGNGLYVNPIRVANANVVTRSLSYNTTTKEITYSPGATIQTAMDTQYPSVQIDNAQFAIDNAGHPTVGAVSGTWSGPYSVQAQLWDGSTYPVTTHGSNGATWSSVASYGFGVTFANPGDQVIGYFTDNNNHHVYRVTWMAASVGAGSGNGFIQVQKLV